MIKRKKNLALSKIVKLGVSSVRAKPIRFAVTIVLFVFCLSIVGWSFTLLFADSASGVLKAYRKAETKEAIVAVGKTKIANDKSTETELHLTETEAKSFREKNPGFVFDTIYDFNNALTGIFGDTMTRYYQTHNFNGCVEISDAFLKRYGYKMLAGRLPNNAREAVIPEYVFEIYAQYGYKKNGKSEVIQKYDEMVGKILEINSDQVEIVGVMDTNFRGERFELLKKKTQKLQEHEIDAYNDQNMLFTDLIFDGFQTALFVNQDFIRKYITKNFAYFGAKTIVTDFDEMGVDVKIGEIVSYGSFFVENRSFVNVLGVNDLSPNDVILPKTYLKSYLEKLNQSEENSCVNDEKIENLIREGFTVPMSLQSRKFELSDIFYLVTSDYRVVGYFEDMTEENGMEVVVSEPYFILSDEKYENTVGKISEKPLIGALATCLSDRDGENKNLIRTASEEIDVNRMFRVCGIVSTDATVIKRVDALGKNYGWVPGVVMAIFSALMMFNFISATISAKRKDIGILRAIGTTNRTVYLIFAAESLFTAILSFLVSLLGSIGLCVLTNAAIPLAVGYIWFLSYGVGEIVLVLLIGVAIALIGSLIPILKLIRKKPMEIMR